MTWYGVNSDNGYIGCSSIVWCAVWCAAGLAFTTWNQESYLFATTEKATYSFNLSKGPSDKGLVCVCVCVCMCAHVCVHACTCSVFMCVFDAVFDVYSVN